jgi:hypothetical protein
MVANISPWSLIAYANDRFCYITRQPVVTYRHRRMVSFVDNKMV